MDKTTLLVLIFKKFNFYMFGKKKKKILIVEDDAMLIKVLSKGIKKAGFDTEEVMSGLKVVSAAKKFKPDLILLDIILPGLDGFGVLKLLKSDKTLKKIPVVVLSNLDKPADVISAKALGSVQYIIKANTKIDEIIKIIKKTLKI